MLILQADNCHLTILLPLQPFSFGGELFSEYDHLLYSQLSVSRRIHQTIQVSNFLSLDLKKF